MLVLILILALVVLAGLGFLVAIWFISRSQGGQQPREKTAPGARFRLKYIVAPLIVLVLSAIVSAIYYPHLPVQVGYHFLDSGPDRWLSRESALALMLVPQFLLVLMGGGIISVAARMGLAQGSPASAGRIFTLIGNVAALPQLILAFAMLDIFYYNSYQVRILPSWAFLVFLGLATAVLAILLISMLRRVRASLAG